MTLPEAMTELISDQIILWQDYTHPQGYRPELRMLIFPDGKKALKLSVFGKVTVVPFTRAECKNCESPA